jgi:excisionase family DNA binding protein
MKEETKNNNLQELFTIREVSNLAGISEQEIIRLIMLKEIKAVKIGRSIRISEMEFDIFLKKLCNTVENDRAHEITRGQLKERVLYTTEQVAKILQLSIDNVWLLLQKGRLKGFKIREGRSSWRIPAESLEEFIADRSGSSAVY